MNKLFLLLLTFVTLACDSANTINLSSAFEDKKVSDIADKDPTKRNKTGKIGISLNGSTTISPVMEKLIERFIKYNPDYIFDLRETSSHQGIEALMNKETDIALSSVGMHNEHKFDFHERKMDFVELYLGGDALAIIVNVNNKAKGVTKEVIKDIFTGNIQEWEVNNGLDKNIKIFSRDTTSGTYHYFKDQVLENNPISSNAIILKDSKAIMDSVRHYKNAIGYVSFAQLDYSVEPLDISFDQGATFVKLRNEHVENFQYKFVRPLYLYYTPESYNKLKPFIEFIKSDEGRALIFEEGYIPVSKSLIEGLHQQSFSSIN